MRRAARQRAIGEVLLALLETDGNKNELMTYGALGALILAPVTGGASLLVAGAAAAGGYAGFETSSQDKLSAETAHARAQHLTTLFNSKGCRVPVAPKR